jgi:uncharacterized membrane protein
VTRLLTVAVALGLGYIATHAAAAAIGHGDPVYGLFSLGLLAIAGGLVRTRQ